jgi:hypothetical protein
MAGDRMKPPGIDAAGRAAGCGLALMSCAPQAHAHLVETGLGPVYDGIAHFALTPEDLIPALALAVLAATDHSGQALSLVQRCVTPEVMPPPARHSTKV